MKLQFQILHLPGYFLQETLICLDFKCLAVDQAVCLVNGLPRFYHFTVAFCLFARTWPRHKQGAVVLAATKSVAVLQNPPLSTVTAFRCPLA